MSNKDKSSAITSSPTSPMSERTLCVTLERIEAAQEEQTRIESERAGAAKLRTRILTAFGGIITAAAVAGFAWVWDAQTTNALQDAAIRQVHEDADTHDPTPPGHEDLIAHDSALDRRVDGIDRAQKAINMRLDRRDREQTKALGEILTEIRRHNRRPATWGE